MGVPDASVYVLQKKRDFVQYLENSCHQAGTEKSELGQTIPCGRAELWDLLPLLRQ